MKTNKLIQKILLSLISLPLLCSCTNSFPWSKNWKWYQQYLNASDKITAILFGLSALCAVIWIIMAIVLKGAPREGDYSMRDDNVAYTILVLCAIFMFLCVLTMIAAVIQGKF